MKCKDCKYRLEMWEGDMFTTKFTGQLIRHLSCNNPKSEHYYKDIKWIDGCDKGEK